LAEASTAAPGRTAARIVQVLGFWLGFIASVALSVLARPAGGGGLWISNGVLAAAFLVVPGRWRIGLALACVGSEVAIRLWVGDPVPRVAINAAINLAEAVAAAALALRFCGLDARRLNLNRLSRLLVLAIVPAAVAASALAAASGAVLFHRDFWVQWRDWSMAGGLGMAVMMPAVLLVARYGQYRDFHRGAAETAGLFAAMALVGGLTLWQSELPLFFIVFPMMTLIAFRLGPPGAAIAACIVGVLAITFCLGGRGPAMLAANLDMAGRLRLTQGMVAACLFTGVATAIALADQTRLRRLLAWRDRSARSARRRAQEAEAFAAQALGRQIAARRGVAERQS
jgi:integral membrane sensor domain MASE1